MADEAALEDILGYQFEDRDLLIAALTHPSVGGRRNYQRLEFLGDRILGAVIADELFRKFPDMNEGELALRYNGLVRRETLAVIASKIGVGPFIRLSAGEDESGGREKPAILADICEALIAALYLDGGLGSARRFVRMHWQDLVAEARKTQKDGKTALQEWAQARGLGTPVYKERDRSGPSHAPKFTIEVTLGNDMKASGMAGSKRAAEQAAADSLMNQIREQSA